MIVNYFGNWQNVEKTVQYNNNRYVIINNIHTPIVPDIFFESASWLMSKKLNLRH